MNTPYRDYCECGSSVYLAGPFSLEAFKEWEKLHSGPGHEERVTSYEARMIREGRRIEATKKLKKG